jgi:uncharacterized protein (TIGR00251 family)
MMNAEVRHNSKLPLTSAFIIQHSALPILCIRTIPRASKSVIAGRRGDALLVRLAAPPVEGAANEALIELLSRTLRRPRRDITIVSGERSREKRVAIEGISADELSARISDILSRID